MNKSTFQKVFDKNQRKYSQLETFFIKHHKCIYWRIIYVCLYKCKDLWVYMLCYLANRQSDKFIPAAGIDIKPEDQDATW